MSLIICSSFLIDWRIVDLPVLDLCLHENTPLAIESDRILSSYTFFYQLANLGGIPADMRHIKMKFQSKKIIILLQICLDCTSGHTFTSIVVFHQLMSQQNILRYICVSCECSLVGTNQI